MLQDIDKSIKMLLQSNDPKTKAPDQLRNAEISFETPDRSFTPDKPTVNLFLYEVKENRELRDRVPLQNKVGNKVEIRLPPIRMDCCYMVTAWSADQKEAKIMEEHLLLSQALIQLSRFPDIETGYLTGSLSNQPFPLPISVAQIDAIKEMRDFWTALGIPPRALFHLVITIAMIIPQEAEIAFEVHDRKAHITTVFAITGKIINSQTATGINGATIRILELDRETTSDAEGHYQFTNLNGGGTYTLQCVAQGFASMSKKVLVPGKEDAFDISLLPLM